MKILYILLFITLNSHINTQQQKGREYFLTNTPVTKLHISLDNVDLVIEHKESVGVTMNCADSIFVGLVLVADDGTLQIVSDSTELIDINNLPNGIFSQATGRNSQNIISSGDDIVVSFESGEKAENNMELASREVVMLCLDTRTLVSRIITTNGGSVSWR